MFKEGPKGQSEVCQGHDEGQSIYRMAIQEARAERCTELEESEATYFEALSENAVT